MSIIMKLYIARAQKCCTVLILCVLLLNSTFANICFADENSRTIKVAFPKVEGFTEITESGKRKGLVVDYLNEISKYTNWEYEFIDLNSSSIIDEFIAGKFDLMGGTYYSDSFEKYFAYPKYNTGYSKAVLLSRYDDESIKSFDLNTLNGKTIGVYEKATENLRRLNDFLKMNDLECDIKFLKYENISSDGNFHPFLINGDVDLLLVNGFENIDGFNVAASFDSQPHYIVTQPNADDILADLNMALDKIYSSDPNFAQKCYDKHFSALNTARVQLSTVEKDYIQQKKSITVAVPRQLHPMVCRENHSNTHKGIVIDIFDKISGITGLEILYQYTESYNDAIQAVQNGDADILGFFLDSEEAAINMGLVTTQEYITMNNIMLRNKSVSYPSDGLTGAIISGQELPDGIKAEELKTYDNINEALIDADQGKIDFVCGLSAIIEMDIQQHNFSNLVPVSLFNNKSEINFAMKKPADINLLSVLNKMIGSIPEEEISLITNRNMIFIGENEMSIRDLAYSNPMLFIGIITAILLLLLMIVIIVSRSRIRAAAMQSELEKSEANNKAKGEFLSRMSHEIRTPMNAVVGLTDLTAMMDDVPQNIKDNLSKIRSSSHYLLSLINDILDMNRIDSGMMKIDNEPFSLNIVLDEIHSMMSVEALRRGIAFSIDSDVSHTKLLGDAVRLRQVLTNLLSNAFKFTNTNGKVTMNVKELSYNEHSTSIYFSVTDNGIGIEKSDQERIFESFEQAGTNRSKSQGTGLGLPISKNIINLMGGELNLMSSPGNGSTFYFTIKFPINTCEEKVAAPLKADDIFAGVNILVVEDNDLNAEIAMEILKMQGAITQRATNGKEAVKIFSNSAPGEFKIILMDIQMPVMNGLEATKKIRELNHPTAKTIPIIAMTANSFKEDADDTIKAGMNGFVPKPLDINYLYGEIKRLL